MAKNDFDELMSIGVDIGKDVFYLVGFNKEGQLVLRKKIKRMALISTFEELPHCIVGMEACMSAHFVSRTLRRRLRPIRLTAPFCFAWLVGGLRQQNVPMREPSSSSELRLGRSSRRCKSGAAR